MARRGDIVPPMTHGADQPATQAHHPLLRHPCPICLERLEYETLCIVQCGHLFCYDCIATALEHQLRALPEAVDDDDDAATPEVIRCPVCRVAAPPTAVYRVPRDTAGEPYDPRPVPGAFDPFVLAACEQEAADEQEEHIRLEEELKTARQQQQQEEEAVGAVDAADDDDDDHRPFVADSIVAYDALTDSCTFRWRAVGGGILETQELMPGLVAAARLVAGGESWIIAEWGAAELGP